MSEPVDPSWLSAADADHTSSSDVAGYYDKWAADYAADLQAWDYRAPVRASSLLLDHAPGLQRVLDAGCGTGMAGTALRRAGFVGELHGGDISQASLDQAKRTGAYQRLDPLDLQQPLEIEDDSYGGLLCVGVMTYVPQVKQCWSEFCRIVSPGGVVVVTQRDDHWQNRDCQRITFELESEGLWEPLLVTEAEPYLPGSPGDLAEFGVHYLVARTAP